MTKMGSVEVVKPQDEQRAVRTAGVSLQVNELNGLTIQILTRLKKREIECSISTSEGFIGSTSAIPADASVGLALSQVNDNLLTYHAVIYPIDMVEICPQSAAFARTPTSSDDINTVLTFSVECAVFDKKYDFSMRRIEFLRPIKYNNRPLLQIDSSEVTALPPYRGALEVCSLEGVDGWCLDTRNNLGASVHLYLEGHYLNVLRPNIDRPDIEKPVGRPVQCGFKFILPTNSRGLRQPIMELIKLLAEVLPEYKPFFDVQVADSEYSLQRILNFETAQMPSSETLAKLLMPESDEHFTPQQARQDLRQTVAAEMKQSPAVKLIAFYLPQYHPVPENDEWWGTGFTEWTNVSTAKPLFDGHYQPHIPADLGFYDLRLPEIREQQARLAREHGIHGFCYYYYWFSGRKILETPIQAMLKSGTPDFPFCICWANESWSRRWDGSENESLLYQSHDIEIDKQFIHDVLPLLKDQRYITVDDCPLIIIYRVSLLPDPAVVFASWRLAAKANGLPGLHICMAETFGLTGPFRYGCDSSVEFPPHRVVSPLVNKELGLGLDYTGNIYDYNQVIENDLNALQPDYPRYRTVMLSWDNTARRGKAGNVFYGSSPERYEVWLRGAIRQTCARMEGDNRLMFVNAWNEWAEGTHLEPDRKYGRRYLQATRRALFDTSNWQTVLQETKARREVSRSDLAQLVSDLERRFSALQVSNDFLVKANIESRRIYWGRSSLAACRPAILADKPTLQGGHFVLERVNQFPRSQTYILSRSNFLNLEGWFFFPGVSLDPGTLVYLMLSSLSDSSESYYGTVFERQERMDVVKHTGAKESEALWSGFQFNAALSELPAGEYSLSVVLPNNIEVYERRETGSLILV